MIPTDIWEINQQNSKLRSEVQSLREAITILTQNVDSFKLDCRVRF